ncbi:AroM family protein [Enterobacteriaceae bacterium 4M9]|nr:AroM family protein [Enterobacteriaceae bacterium 4M9]
MNTSLAILSVGAVPVDEIMPLLTEDIPEQQITHLSLLGRLSADEVTEDYGASAHEKTLQVQPGDGPLMILSHQKVEQALQAVIEVLDAQGYDVIMVLGGGYFPGLTTRSAILLVPDRIVPPLVASIVDGHQVGILLPALQELTAQQQKWQGLEMPPIYGPEASLSDDAALVHAGGELKTRGADVLVLDCLGFQQRHRDLLQKSLEIPVLLSHTLVARLASELLL